MIANNSRTHILNAKNELMKRENQYTTQKKILRPSDDPTIAIRSLQLRTSYAKLEQYVDKNIKEAMGWMNVTEMALSNIGGPTGVLTDMKGYLNQGANDYLDAEHRTSVLTTLRAFSDGIFQDSANTDYIGRYLFTGYRTDTSLLFPNREPDLAYEITENFDSNAIRAIKYVTGGATYTEGMSADEYAESVPVENSAYRMALSYKNCSIEDVEGLESETAPIAITLRWYDEDGELQEETLDAEPRLSSDTEAYTVESGVAYLYDTGELIFSEEAYGQVQANHAEISVTYVKEGFDRNEIRPEMYFECNCYDKASETLTRYRDPSNQDISYEVNVNQSLIVNTQAKDAITTEIYRALDYIEQTIQAVDDVEKKISDVENMIANTPETDPELENYEKLKEMLEQEQQLLVGAMTEAFGMGLTMVDTAQDKINVALADLGTRYKRGEILEDKVDEQKINTEERLSENEDVDIAEAYINLTQADNLYQAALMATSKILGNSLLNYI